MVDIEDRLVGPKDVETEVAYEDEDEDGDDEESGEGEGGSGESGVAGVTGEGAETVQAGPASDLIEKYYQEKLGRKEKKPGSGAPGGGDAGEGAGMAELGFALIVQQFALN